LRPVFQIVPELVPGDQPAAASPDAHVMSGAVLREVKKA
jgi:hypothetical protein